MTHQTHVARMPHTPHPFEAQQQQGMIVAEYSNIKQAGTYITSEGELLTVPSYGLKEGYSPVIGIVRKKKIWALKLTDEVINHKKAYGLETARRIALQLGVTNINF